MRKLLFLTVIALLSVGTLSAQNRAVRDARRALQNNELSEARTLIQQAIAHPETANDPQAWRLKGDIGNRALDNEMTNMMLGRQANELAMFNGLFESFAPYVKADSLGQIPDARGRVRNPVRRDIASIMRANHQHFIAGGGFFNQKGEHSRAADFFEIFWDIPSLPMFEDAREPFVLDTTFQEVKYFAALSALQAGEYQRANRMLNRILNEPFIENSLYTERDVYEFLATTYLVMGDSVSYVNILRRGVARFPTDSWLVRNLIHEYIVSGETEQALAGLDDLIASDPAGGIDLIIVRGALLAEKGDTEGAIREYRRALVADPRNEIALEALARHYMFQAQELRDEVFRLPRARQAEGNKQVLELYQLSLPLLETLEEVLSAREDVTEREMTGVWMLLRNVYYNLSLLGVDKDAQFEAVERKLGY